MKVLAIVMTCVLGMAWGQFQNGRSLTNTFGAQFNTGNFEAHGGGGGGGRFRAQGGGGRVAGAGGAGRSLTNTFGAQFNAGSFGAQGGGGRFVAQGGGGGGAGGAGRSLTNTFGAQSNAGNFEAHSGGGGGHRFGAQGGGGHGAGGAFGGGAGGAFGGGAGAGGAFGGGAGGGGSFGAQAGGVGGGNAANSGCALGTTRGPIANTVARICGQYSASCFGQGLNNAECLGPGVLPTVVAVDPFLAQCHARAASMFGAQLRIDPDGTMMVVNRFGLPIGDVEVVETAFNAVEVANQMRQMEFMTLEIERCNTCTFPIQGAQGLGAQGR